MTGLQLCELCGADPRLMECGHTVCLNCAKTDGSGKLVQCPTCLEKQAMPRQGMAGLARDYAALEVAEMDKMATHGVECTVCGEERATQTCIACKDFHLCEEDATHHAKKHAMKPLEAGAAPNITVMCPTDAGMCASLPPPPPHCDDGWHWPVVGGVVAHHSMQCDVGCGRGKGNGILRDMQDPCLRLMHDCPCKVSEWGAADPSIHPPWCCW